MLFVTYCSRDKKAEPWDIPALDRYLSSRIRAVHDAAAMAGADFRILSGEYGLLAATDVIPCYDHMLIADEVSSLVPVVIEQLRSIEIEKVILFSRSLAEDPNTAPYRETMDEACRLLGLNLATIDIPYGPPAADDLVSLLP